MTKTKLGTLLGLLLTLAMSPKPSLGSGNRPAFDPNHSAWNRVLQFLINAYNAFTVRLIVDHYPVKSIKDIGGFFTSPWKLKFFNLFRQNPADRADALKPQTKIKYLDYDWTLNE